MKRTKLEVKKRDVLGKKVRKLRREGVLPANVYGKDVKSLAVQLTVKEFEKIFKEVGETGLVDLTIDSQVRPVLIHNVQLDPRTSNPVHADFYQVNLKEKVKATVPVEVVGEPAAVSEKVGLLLQPLSEIEVEALPEDLPEKIEFNVEHLATVDQQITVADLKVASGVVVLTDPAQVVVKIGELVSKEAEELVAQEAAAAEAAKAEAGAEGEAAPTEGATPEETTEGEEKAPQEEAKEQPKQE